MSTEHATPDTSRAGQLDPEPLSSMEGLAFGIFMSIQPRSRRQWDEAPSSTRDYYMRRAEAAWYYARRYREPSR